jgi:hypothetical protein
MVRSKHRLIRASLNKGMFSSDSNDHATHNCHDVANFKEAIEHIIAIDCDDELYLQYLREPNFTGNVVNTYADLDNLRKFLFRIVDELPRLSLLTRVQRRSIGWLTFPGHAYESAKNFYHRWRSP